MASFELEVASGGGSPRIRQTGANEFTADQFGGCAEHTFVVIAVGADGQRTRSAPSGAAPACPPTKPVTNLRQTDRTQNSVTIAWDPPNDRTGPLQYRIERANGELLAGFEAQGNAQQFTWGGLGPSQAYTLRVFARDDSGVVSEFRAVDVTTAAPPPWEATFTIQDTNLGATCATQGKRGGAWASSQSECKGWSGANRWLDNGTKVTVVCHSRGDAYPVYPGPDELERVLQDQGRRLDPGRRHRRAHRRRRLRRPCLLIGCAR